MPKTFTKKDRYQMVTDAVLALMEKHGTNWTKPWQASAGNSHHNVVSGKPYQGTNIFMTAISAYSNEFKSNEWASFNQWFILGGGKKEKINGKWVVTKPSKYKITSKGTDIVFFDKVMITDEITEKQAMVPVLKGFSVFNADQVDGYEAKPVEEQAKPEFNHQETEKLVTDSGAIIKHGGNKAFYAPEPDFIQMPEKTDFKGTKDSTPEQSYYGTLLHELCHWSGHNSRLDRKLVGRFGSNAYAFEELIAETGSAFLAAMLGLEKEPTPDHAKYLNSWLEVLKTDKRAMMKAFGQAQKAANYILESQAQAIAAE